MLSSRPQRGRNFHLRLSLAKEQIPPVELNRLDAQGTVSLFRDNDLGLISLREACVPYWLEDQQDRVGIRLQRPGFLQIKFAGATVEVSIMWAVVWNRAEGHTFLSQRAKRVQSSEIRCRSSRPSAVTNWR